ncbi:hypothetical protein TNCV_3408541 [Trichonephila clavipes]|nr:hypothetical protein TNCV_3408541 [Trichonephila clavipes]
MNAKRPQLFGSHNAFALACSRRMSEWEEWLEPFSIVRRVILSGSNQSCDKTADSENSKEGETPGKIQNADNQLDIQN